MKTKRNQPPAPPTGLLTVFGDVPHRSPFDATMPAVERRIVEHVHEVFAAKERGDWVTVSACNRVIATLLELTTGFSTTEE